MGCKSSKGASQPATASPGTLLASSSGKSPKANQSPDEFPTTGIAHTSYQNIPAAEATPSGVNEAALHNQEEDAAPVAEKHEIHDAAAYMNGEVDDTGDRKPALDCLQSSKMCCVDSPRSLRCLPTSQVHQNPQGWQEEGILFPHEGVRFLLQELSTAVRTMDPLPTWKWENLAVWYQDYFYSVVHHHHDAEEAIYLPWIETRVRVPGKVSSDHPELMQAMDELNTMIRKGAASFPEKRVELRAELQRAVEDFVEGMERHLAEEEELIPRLLRDGGFTQEEEGAVVGQIIQSLGLDGNKKALPVMLHAYARWAGAEKAEVFVSSKLPLPIQFLYRNFWVGDFQQRHMGLLASLAYGVDANPFASKWFC